MISTPVTTHAPRSGTTLIHVGFVLTGVMTTLLGPLGHDQRPYLVTVVDAQHQPLLMLGWTPHLEGNLGEGIAWQAPGIRSDAIVGQPVIRPALVNDPEARLRHD